MECAENRREVMTVDDNRVPAERTPSRREDVHIVLRFGRAALAKPVDIGDGAERFERVERPDVRGPHTDPQPSRHTEKDVGR